MKNKNGARRIVEITEKDGCIWCQVFDTKGEIISSFISDSVRQACKKADKFCKSHMENLLNQVEAYKCFIVRTKGSTVTVEPPAGFWESIAGLDIMTLGCFEMEFKSVADAKAAIDNDAAFLEKERERVRTLSNGFSIPDTHTDKTAPWYR
jgi:hypothetical protein